MENESQKIFKEILESIKALDARIERLESGSQHKTGIEHASLPPSDMRKKSLKEFLLECSPSNDVEKTFAIGYFLETYEGITPVNKSDLVRGYRMAREQVPLNINDKVNMLIKRGYMMDAEDKKENMKAWTFTHRGETYIQSAFKNELPHR